VAVLEDWAWWWNVRLDPGRQLGLHGRETTSSARGDLEARAGPPAGLVRRWLGSAGLLEQPLPEQAGLVAG